MSLTKERIDAWLGTLVKELDPDEIEREAKQMQGMARKLYHILKEKAPKPSDVAMLTLADIENFMKKVPVMKIVSTKGLEERHFDRISKIINQEFRITDHTYFKQFQNIEFDNRFEEVEEISMAAAREYSNYKMLEKMERDWDPIKFELKEWGETRTYIHLGAAIEVVQTLLEEQILTTQTMKGSPFAAVYLDRINAWDE